ncbi:L-alanine-DL-glutamate epimerase-like enolase superfamily enzyme [Azospirillum lipoferum]|uniref:Dipeptide epimerase n=1 Tax=Azospirillum lipoferum TaxID=193 RepID=A0A5A9GUI8_AZOLI|nr:MULTISPECIES: N-acetyl-D-Glu racemase DgcA [Azospirillum]KAA0597059.1 dipeptide epimerase [Azospirillum lipoferum]MCP1608549.1 L-alanine-DL-glutamate epimerase-like enolase superfamily enzyme [Azospirillum lipoferum]MDW5536133.1 N-acetyl-D-Glu racemase DgcA [Azospirillum sp. NL1]
MSAQQLTVRREIFPIRGAFRISRGAKTEAAVVVAEVADGPHRGRGECVPYARYGESVDGVVAALETMADAVASGLDRAALARQMPPGAARNALDCALWDLEAKRSGVPVWKLAGLTEPPGPLVTCYTLSVDEPEIMAAAARERAPRHPLLKMKLTGEGDLDRVRAVRAAAPAARLVVDANEGWTLDQLHGFAPVLAGLGVEMIEQPLPAGQDEALRGVDCPVPLGADESCHGLESLERLRGLYRVVNVKLDKTGGLTEALAMTRAAHAMGFEVMVGCMVATSLAMAPAMLVGQGARYVDLDGPLLLARDREPGLVYDGAVVQPPVAALWG